MVVLLVGVFQHRSWRSSPRSRHADSARCHPWIASDPASVTPPSEAGGAPSAATPDGRRPAKGGMVTRMVTDAAPIGTGQERLEPLTSGAYRRSVVGESALLLLRREVTVQPLDGHF